MLAQLLVIAAPLAAVYLLVTVWYRRLKQFAHFPQLKPSLIWGHLQTLHEFSQRSPPGLHIGIPQCLPAGIVPRRIIDRACRCHPDRNRQAAGQPAHHDVGSPARRRPPRGRQQLRGGRADYALHQGVSVERPEIANHERLGPSHRPAFHFASRGPSSQIPSSYDCKILE